MEGILRKQCKILLNYLGFDYDIVEMKMDVIAKRDKICSKSAIVLALN